MTTRREREPQHVIQVTEHELRAIIQAVHKDREYSPEPNIMRPSERDDLLHSLKDVLAAITGTEWE